MGAWSGAASPGNAPRAGSGSNSSVRTGAPVIPSKVAAPTKRVAAGVCTTRTEWPALAASRASSTALYAEMPPVTPRRILAITAPYPLPAVAVLDLVGGDLLEG